MSRGSSQDQAAQCHLRAYHSVIIERTLAEGGGGAIHPKYRRDTCLFCKAGIPYRMGEEGAHNTVDGNECLAPDPEEYIVILEEKIEALRKSSMADILAESVKTISNLQRESAVRLDQLRDLSNSSRSFSICLNKIRDLIKKEIGDESANQD